MPAHHVALATDDFAHAEILHIAADLHNLAHKLVPHHQRHRHRFAGPIVPLINVQVRAANARAIHLDEHIPGGHRGLRHILEPQPGGGLAFY